MLAAEQRGQQPDGGANGEEADDRVTFGECAGQRRRRGALVAAGVRPGRRETSGRLPTPGGDGDQPDHEVAPGPGRARPVGPSCGARGEPGLLSLVRPDDEHRVGGGEAERPAGQPGQPGRLQLGAVDLVARAGQHLAHAADPVHGHEGHDHPPRLARFDRRGKHVVVPAAGEYGVGGRQAGQDIRGAAGHDLQENPVRRGVAADATALVLVALDSDGPGAEPGALHRHRARPRADVPDRPARAGAEPGQDQGPDLGLGDHGIAVLEVRFRQRPACWGALMPGQPGRGAGLRDGRGGRRDRKGRPPRRERRAPGRRARAPGTAGRGLRDGRRGLRDGRRGLQDGRRGLRDGSRGLRDGRRGLRDGGQRDEHVRVRDLGGGMPGEVTDPLAGSTQALRGVDGPARGEQAGPELPRGGFRWPGQNGRLRMGQGGGEDRPGRPAVRGQDESVGPVQAQPGERQGHRGDRRDHHRRDAPGAQRADDAEEPGITGSQHGGRRTGGTDRVERGVQVLNNDALGGRGDGNAGEMPPGPGDHGCASQGGGRRGRQGAPVAADHGDGHAGVSGRSGACGG